MTVIRKWEFWQITKSIMRTHTARFWVSVEANWHDINVNECTMNRMKIEAKVARTTVLMNRHAKWSILDLIPFNALSILGLVLFIYLLVGIGVLYVLFWFRLCFVLLLPFVIIYFSFCLLPFAGFIQIRLHLNCHIIYFVCDYLAAI